MRARTIHSLFSGASLECSLIDFGRKPGMFTRCVRVQDRTVHCFSCPCTIADSIGYKDGKKVLILCLPDLIWFEFLKIEVFDQFLRIQR